MNGRMGTWILLAGMAARGSDVYSLYTDHRAMRMDDILTILIVENAKAGSQSTTKTSKKNAYGLNSAKGSGLLKFVPGFGVSGGSDIGYDGRGGTSREGNLVATIAARIVEVMDNGNLVVEGNKVVEINNEKEIIKVSGIVRPDDIEANNTILSCNISDAHITYSGKGVADTGRRPGVFARFFNWLF